MTKTLIDWCSYTFKDRPLEETVQDFGWQLEDLEQVDRGGNGYRKQLEKDDVRIYYEGRDDMGHLVWLTGRGCRSVENLPTFLVWQDWLGRVRENGGRLTRLDFAIDDRSGLLDMAEIERKVRSGEFSGRSREFRTVVSGGPYAHEGTTVYVGASASSVLVRIYDKAAKERVDGHWVRVELQARRDRADDLAQRYTACLTAKAEAELIQGVLRQYLEFKEPGPNAERSRWATTSWWESFLGDVAKVSLSRKPKDASVERTREWLRRTVAPSLAYIWKADGGSYEFLHELIADGKVRLSDKKWKQAQQHAQGNLDVIEGH